MFVVDTNLAKRIRNWKYLIVFLVLAVFYWISVIFLREFLVVELGAKAGALRYTMLGSFALLFLYRFFHKEKIFDFDVKIVLFTIVFLGFLKRLILLFEIGEIPSFTSPDYETTELLILVPLLDVALIEMWALPDKLSKQLHQIYKKLPTPPTKAKKESASKCGLSSIFMWLEKHPATLAILMEALTIAVIIILGFTNLVAHPHLTAYTFTAKVGSQDDYFYSPCYWVDSDKLASIIGVTNDGQLPVIMDLPEYGFQIYCNGEKKYGLSKGVKQCPPPKGTVEEVELQFFGECTSASDGTIEEQVLKIGDTKLYSLIIEGVTKNIGVDITGNCRLKIEFTTHNKVSALYDEEIKIFE